MDSVPPDAISGVPPAAKSPVSEKALRILHIIIAVFCMALLLALTVTSLLFTTDMNTGNGRLEHYDLHNDNLFLNLTFLIIPFGIFYGLKSYIIKIKQKHIKPALTVWTLLTGFIWVISVQSAPTFDSAFVTGAAQSFAVGDYETLTGGYYLKRFPFQLGYVLFSEIIIRIFRLQGNYIVIELVNVLCLAVAYRAILDMVALSVKKHSVYVFTAILLVLCLQPIMFSTFLYGNLPSFMFSMLSIYMAMKYFDKHLKRDALLSALFIGLSVMLKLNGMIVMAALCIIIFLDYLKTKKLFNLAFLALALIMGISLNPLAVRQYEWRADVKMPQGIPMVSWLAMGMSDSSMGTGWYSSAYTIKNYEDSGNDSSLAAENSVVVIRERLTEFKENPGYAFEFFSEKFASQWNEPTYQSIWTNQVCGFYQDPSGIGKLITGEGEPAAKVFIGFHQQFIFFFCCAGVFFMLKRKDFALLILPLIAFGGFAYHMLFEAKSQYILIYFVMLIPVAAYGLEACVHSLESMEKQHPLSFKQHHAGKGSQ